MQRWLQMPTEILRPNGAGLSASLTASAGSNYQCVDEVSANGDTDYVSTTVNTQLDYYALDNTALTTETVDSVDAWTEARVLAGAGGGDLVAPGVRVSGSDSSGSAGTLTTSYVARESAALARPGGGSWAVSDLDGMQFKLVLQENGTSESRCTQVYVEINYTAGAGTAVKDVISMGMIPFAR